MKVINVLAVLVVLIMVAWAGDRNGHKRCQAAVERAQQKQALNDQKALANMATRQQRRSESYVEQQKIIQAVHDPAGCVYADVPAQRVERLHNLYSRPARPGAD